MYKRQQYCIQNFSEIQTSNVLSRSSDVVVISLRFADMERDEADQILNEFHLIRAQMKIMNEKHTENMAICRNLATTVQCRLDAIDAQIRKYFLN